MESKAGFFCGSNDLPGRWVLYRLPIKIEPQEGNLRFAAKNVDMVCEKKIQQNNHQQEWIFSGSNCLNKVYQHITKKKTM